MKRIKNAIEEGQRRLYQREHSSVFDPPPIYDNKGIPNTNFERDFNQNTYKLISETEYHIRQINSIRQKLNRSKRSINIINVSLLIMAILFVIGVIYPLAMLPFNNTYNYSFTSLNLISNNLISPKNILLLIIFVIFIMSLYFAFLLNRNSLTNKNYLNNLTKYEALENFSEYLRIYQENA